MVSAGQRMNSSHSGGGRVRGSAVLFAGVVAFGLLILPGVALLQGSIPAPRATSGDPTLTPAFSSTPCGLLMSEYVGGGLQYSVNYTQMFREICRTTAFVTLVDGVAANGFFAIGSGGTDEATLYLFFYLDWTANCTNASYGPPTTECDFQATWTGYLSNNSVSGPLNQQFPDICTGCDAPHIPPPYSGNVPWVPLVVVLVILVTAAALAAVIFRRLGPPTPDPRAGDAEGGSPPSVPEGGLPPKG
jgi:hypothetical protein